jgi:hypothetical protein
MSLNEISLITRYPSRWLHDSIRLDQSCTGALEQVFDVIVHVKSITCMPSGPRITLSYEQEQQTFLGFK